MPHFDLPLAALREYRTAASEPADLDAFWARAIAVAKARAFEPLLEPHLPDVYGALDVQDVTFAGGDGDPIRAWYLRPRSAGTAPLACRVVFIGYGGGRGLPHDHTLYAAAGHAVFVMDTRAQGGE